MKIMVIYDSAYGNTEIIARVIGKTLEDKGEVSVHKVNDVKPEDITGTELLIVGSPTRWFSPTGAIVNFISAIPENALRGVKIATFDTRFSFRDVRSRLMYNLMILLGYAARPLARKLIRKGGKCIIKPEGFFIEESKGPLKENEVERAVDWANKIFKAYKNQNEL